MQLDHLRCHDTVSNNDHELYGLPRNRILHRNGCAFDHARNFRDHGFDLTWVDVEAADQDHVLLSINNTEIPGRIYDAKVTGQEESILIDELPGFGLIAPIAL